MPVMDKVTGCLLMGLYISNDLREPIVIPAV